MRGYKNVFVGEIYIGEGGGVILLKRMGVTEKGNYVGF